MLWKGTDWFWKIGFTAIHVLLLFFISGCSETPWEDTVIVETESQLQTAVQEEEAKRESIEEICLDIYERAAEENKLDDLEVIRRMVNRFGEHGYPAVDSKNQIDMTRADEAAGFCEKVELGKAAEISMIEVRDSGGFVKYDLRTNDGKVEVTRHYYKFEDGKISRKATGSYQAEHWNYTNEGYLMFSGTWFSEEEYVLMAGWAEEHVAWRIEPLEETYRELNRKYLLPVGFERNNMFLVDWSEEDFGELNFYDMYDIFYPKVNSGKVPYTADENLGVGAVYEIPEEEFESVILSYFKMDSGSLKSKAIYRQEDKVYEYRPRGFYEVEFPEYPYPEVVGVTNNDDGTITLRANVVFPYSGNSKVYAHQVVVRPLEDGGVQYVSNRMIPWEGNQEETWHTPRLTREEWEKVYGPQDTAYPIAKKAAQIRAVYKSFKAMDALQLAAAVKSGCDIFLTNDKQLRQFKELTVMTMDDL